MLLGLVPGLITFIVFAVALISVLGSLGPLSGWILNRFTTAENGWTSLLQAIIALGVVAASIVVVVYLYATVTLLVGTPFFERISAQVDDNLGHAPVRVDETPWRSTLRGIGESLAMLSLTLPLGIGLFLVSLIPVVGTLTALTLGALFGGWFLSLELTSFPLSQRGMASLRERRHILQQHRPVAIGFGTMVFVAFLIPGGAVLMMPAAVSGGTLLARRIVGESTTLVRT
jgi:CysZ protein